MDKVDGYRLSIVAVYNVQWRQLNTVDEYRDMTKMMRKVYNLFRNVGVFEEVGKGVLSQDLF